MTPHDLNTPKPGNPNTQIVNDSLGVSEQWGEKAGFPNKGKDFVPGEIIEGVMYVETGGDLENCGTGCPWQGTPGSSAVWPMNVEPDGGEAGYWTQITGIPFDNTIPKDYPNDIDANIEVGILGLGNDFISTAQAQGLNNPSWFDAAMTYFTGDPNPETAALKSDGFNTGAQYAAGVRNYIQSTYGSNVVAYLDAGKWDDSTAPGSTWVDPILDVADKAKNKAKDEAGKIANDVIGGIVGAIAPSLPRILAFIGGAFLIIVGGYLLFGRD